MSKGWEEGTDECWGEGLWFPASLAWDVDKELIEVGEWDWCGRALLLVEPIGGAEGQVLQDQSGHERAVGWVCRLVRVEEAAIVFEAAGETGICLCDCMIAAEPDAAHH